MQIILLVIGLILVIALPTLFTGAAAVGWICLGVFAAITLFQLIAFGLVAWGGSKAVKSTRRW